MQQLDVPIIWKTYEFFHALHDLHKSIPRLERYTLWQRCENHTIELLETLIRTGYFPQEERSEHLIKASVLLDTLRVLIRFSFEVKSISQEKYISLEAKLDEIGRMLGGWLKSLKQKAPTQS